MAGYIGRRLLVMIPTVLGITFLVFMLLALSPGGIGASLRAAGGQMESSKAALVEAYLEDRYGLDDPAVVQYARWLGRISPIKFGRRELVNPQGDLVRAPKPLHAITLEGTAWLPTVEIVAAPASPQIEGGEEGLRRAFLATHRAYAKGRADYLVARKAFDRALVHYATAVGAGDAVTADAKPRLGWFSSHSPDNTSSAWAEVLQAGGAMQVSFAAAESLRTHMEWLFDQRPYPPVGVPIIPSTMSIAAPDLGVAFSRGRPVMDLIMDALPVTVLINVIASPLIYLIAVPTGLLAAARRGGWFDIASGALFVALWSVPTVWAGVMMIGYLADNQYLGWFPVSGLVAKDAADMTFLPSWPNGQFSRGWLLDSLWHLALPVGCLVYGGFAVLAKQTRAAVLDNASMDYVRTARAKGVPSRDVLIYHTFRNSLLPLITIFVSVFPAMLAGSVVVERIFSIPGMGSLMLDAINLRDRELILADTFMISLVNLVALLLADILYAMADPRVSYE